MNENVLIENDREWRRHILKEISFIRKTLTQQSEEVTSQGKDIAKLKVWNRVAVSSIVSLATFIAGVCKRYLG